MSTEGPRVQGEEMELQVRFPSDVYDFLTTPDLKLETLTRSHRGEIQPYVRLTRKAVVGDEVGLKTVSESIHVFEDTLKVFDSALFSGIRDVVPESPIAIAQQNFLAVRLAIRNFKP